VTLGFWRSGISLAGSKRTARRLLVILFTYIDAKHSLHFKVTGTRVENEGERRRGHVADRAHDAEREETNDGYGEDGAGR